MNEEKQLLGNSNAFGCRWFDVLTHSSVAETRPELIDIENLEVLVDFSEQGYSGKVSVAFLSHDQNFVCYIEYSYGSCGYCDNWEDHGEDVAREDILHTMVILPPTEFIKFASQHKFLQPHINQLVLRLFN